jgi:HAD superfamily hydrolase (TIGR01548 family)
MTSYPSVIIFDVDGVLVDTRGSYQRTTLETVKIFSGKRVTRRELHQWKNRPGFNDDWKLSTAWVNSLGGNFKYKEVKEKFVELYWGKGGNGYVTGEKWLFPIASLRRLGKVAELAIFTGRVRYELTYTLRRSKSRKFFKTIMTAEDVKRPKPDPDGLLKILKGRDPGIALYVGDNVDDALAAQSAKIAFVGILPRWSEERRQRGALLRKLGALAILGSINELESWLQETIRPTAKHPMPGTASHRRTKR